MELKLQDRFKKIGELTNQMKCVPFTRPWSIRTNIKVHEVNVSASQIQRN